MALDLKGMVRWGESSQVADLLDEYVYTAFVLFRELDVLDRSTFHTDQVVVVTSDPLSQLVASDAASAEVRFNHVCIFENYERAVQRRHRNSFADLSMKIGRRAWPRTLRHCSDHQAPPSRVADAAFS